jgi:hypothetical protein
MKKVILYVMMTVLLLMVIISMSTAQGLLPHIVYGTVLNPDNSAPAEKEIMFCGYLTKAPNDTSAPDSCSDGGGWAIDVVNKLPNSNWQVGDELVVIFTNIGPGDFIGASQKLVYKTTSDSPEQAGNFTLPVEMTTFEALVQHGDWKDEVVLQWKTVGETNNYGFEVQRSTNGKNFEKIGFVAGAGSTNIAQLYKFVDGDVAIATYHYRLRQIDTNGSFSLSEIKEITVTPPTSYALSQNFPNPFNPVTNIIFRMKEDNQVTIRIFDILGREVATLVDRKMKAGTHTISFNATELPSGIYLYSMDTGDFREVKKMAVIK